MSEDTTDPKNKPTSNDKSTKIEKAYINESQKSYSDRFSDLNNKQNAKPYINDDLIQKPASDNKANNTTDNNSAD